MNINLFIISLSIILQMASVVLGVKLIQRTGKRIAGVLIITAISLMTFRRVISLYRQLFAGPIRTDTVGESTGLLVSLLIVIGVLYLTRLILSEQKIYASLANSEKRYRLLAENAGDLICCHAPHVGFHYISPSCREMFGYTPDELVGKDPEDLFHPDDRVKIRQTYSLLVTSPAILTESGRIRHKDGDYLWVEIKVKAIANADTGLQIEIVTTVRDITERKQAEEDIKTLNYQLERRIAERTAELEASNKSLHEKKEALSQAYTEMEARVRERTAELNTINSALTAEITERARTEEALRESRKQYQQLFTEMSCGLLVFDVVYNELGEPMDYRLVNANPACQRLSGITIEDKIGKTGNEMPFGWSPELLERFYQVAVTSQTIQYERYNETLGRHYETYIFSPKRGQFAHLFNDITSRKQIEQQLQCSLREKDVLLKEIHHRVKNNMQVIYSLLNLQAKGIADTFVRAMFEEARNRVKSMALIHEKLYQAMDLAHINFREYLINLVQGVAETYKRQGVVCAVDMESMALDVNVGIPCGLIVNELVSNSLKHGFPDGREGLVRVGINTNSEGNNVLTVANNGVSFPETVDFRNTTSLGMQLVNVLTGQIHGTIKLSTDEGTEFTITFPGTPGIGGVPQKEGG
jgi:PAS domain S-box-containing protein